MLFPTTLVGSYPQPEWLIDRKKLAARFPPRVRAKELWRIPEPLLAEAQQDATLLAIRCSPRRSRTRRCSRSAPRKKRGWTSSPTARSGARATPTASPPPSRA